MLEVDAIDAFYGTFQALWKVSLNVKKGEIVCLLGPNGSGKSTLVKSISAHLRIRNGSIRFCGEAIDRLPAHKIVERGVSHVLERRHVFPFMSVQENLELGAFVGKARGNLLTNIDRMYSLFPILSTRRKQLAGFLSGGEQQMLAIARGLMAEPRLLIIDEPTLGLAPLMVEQLVDLIMQINVDGTTILFIQHDVHQALGIADRGYVLDSGRIVMHGTGSDLLSNEELRRVYMGI